MGDRVRVLQYDQQRQNSNAHASTTSSSSSSSASAPGSESSTSAPGSASSSGGAPSAVFDDLRVTRLTKRCGVETVHIEEAVAGDVVSLAGAMQAGIADTIASPCRQEPLDPGHIDPPTLRYVVGLSKHQGSAKCTLGQSLHANTTTVTYEHNLQHLSCSVCVTMYT